MIANLEGRQIIHVPSQKPPDAGETVRRREEIQKKIVARTEFDIGLITQSNFAKKTRLRSSATKLQPPDALADAPRAEPPRAERTLSLQTLSQKLQLDQTKSQQRWLKKDTRYTKWNQHSFDRHPLFPKFATAQSSPARGALSYDRLKISGEKQLFKNHNLNLLLRQSQDRKLQLIHELDQIRSSAAKLPAHRSALARTLQNPQAPANSAQPANNAQQVQGPTTQQAQQV